MQIINCIKNNFINAIIERCSERGCKLRLNDLNDHVILKGEIICQDRKICDCIIFTEGIIIGIIELKSRSVHANKIVEKLTNGSEIALDILEECNDKRISFEFYHIILSKRWRTSERKIIISNKIPVRGKKYDIIPKSCGFSFSEAIFD